MARYVLMEVPVIWWTAVSPSQLLPGCSRSCPSMGQWCGTRITAAKDRRLRHCGSLPGAVRRRMRYSSIRSGFKRISIRWTRSPGIAMDSLRQTIKRRSIFWQSAGCGKIFASSLPVTGYFPEIRVERTSSRAWATGLPSPVQASQPLLAWYRLPLRPRRISNRAFRTSSSYRYGFR